MISKPYFTPFLPRSKDAARIGARSCEHPEIEKEKPAEAGSTSRSAGVGQAAFFAKTKGTTSTTSNPIPCLRGCRNAGMFPSRTSETGTQIGRPHAGKHKRSDANRLRRTPVLPASQRFLPVADQGAIDQRGRAEPSRVPSLGSAGGQFLRERELQFAVSLRRDIRGDRKGDRGLERLDHRNRRDCVKYRFPASR